MRWLMRLVAPVGAHVFDPFMGSGSGGCAAVMEGMAFTGIERGDPPGDSRFVEISKARIEHWRQQASV
jgi:site-specific DNA-methyltransferase (adenine-specific)